MLTDHRLCMFQLERPTLVAEVCYAVGEALACERARVGIEDDVTVNQTFNPIDATQVYNVLAVLNNSSHFYQIAQELLEELEEQGIVEHINFAFPIRMYHYRIWRQNAIPAERLRKSGYSFSFQQSLPEVSERSEQLKQMEGFDFEQLIADRGYAAEDFIDYLIERSIKAVIPPHQRAKILREYDAWLYRERHLVECFINKIKHFPRVFSRFDKLDSSFLAFLQYITVLIWLR
jgi:transposase